MVLHYKSYSWSGISFCSPITNAEASHLKSIQFGICTAVSKFTVPFCWWSCFTVCPLLSYDTLPLYKVYSTFFILSLHILISIQNKAYCKTISTVDEKVNVTYKMSINLMSLHFNGTLTKRRIKLLPRDEPNHLAPWWNRPPASQQMHNLPCHQLLAHINYSTHIINPSMHMYMHQWLH